MKPKLKQSVSQRVTLTPQLKQSIKLLQLSSIELEEEIERVLTDNPLLERDDLSIDHAARFSSDGTLINQSNYAQTNNENDTGLNDIYENKHDNTEVMLWEPFKNPEKNQDDENTRPQLEAPPESLHEHLYKQAQHLRISKRQQFLIDVLIDALDTNGYLSETLDDIVQWLPKELNVQLEELEEALHNVQQFDPVGVGARNSSECLALQIQAKKGIAFITRQHALAIVRSHLKLFAQHDFASIKKLIKCDDEDLKEASQIILQCDPHPGAFFATDTADAVIPEVIIVKKNNQFVATLNPEAIPKIHMNYSIGNYLNFIPNQSELHNRYLEAKWFIRNIKQRFETILRVAQAIAEKQQAFFVNGPTKMSPLVLQEIADKLELHESTISRITTQKFMLTPRGIFEFKYFFSNKITSEKGEDASSVAIREQIKTIVANENKKKPYSDNQIAQLLANNGFSIARRTIAKYRTLLHIPSASLRKKL